MFQEPTSFGPLKGSGSRPFASRDRTFLLARGPKRVTVPAHQTIALGILKSIMAQAGIDLDTLAGQL